jgi:hypothetical protein
MLAVAAALLAGLVRSGPHAAWVAAVTCEATLTPVGLVRVATGQYAGGSLLAIATLGLLVHPAIGQALDTTAGRGRPGLREVRVSEQSLAENAGGAIGGGSGQTLARHGPGAGERPSVRGHQSARRRSRYDLVARHPIRGGSRTA